MSKITIDVKSRTPIFEQLRHNIRELALTGVLAPDEQLPSVRALACELAINPNTIQKAYAELERRNNLFPARKGKLYILRSFLRKQGGKR